jgi:hypothetical protein
MRNTLFAGLLALVVPACIVGPGEISGIGEEEAGGEGGGEGSGSGSGVALTPRITATVDKATMATELGKTETLTLTIQSVDGFTGPVSVTPGAVAGFTMTATPASVTLTDGGSATVSVEVKVATNAAELAPQLTIDLGGTATTSVTSALTVANQLTVDIPAGTGAGLHSGLPARNAPIRIRSGASIVFHNSDNMQHVVHADGGIPHENTTAGGMPNTDYKVTVMQSATWYCHDHEGGADSRNVIVE